MTLDELKNALTLAAKDEETESISSMEDVDLAKIRGVVLIDNNFVNFFKQNLVDIDIDFDKEQLTLGYEYLEKDPHEVKWYKRVGYQVIPISMITKVLILSNRTDYVSTNIPFGPRLERNEPYYLFNPLICNETNE